MEFQRYDKAKHSIFQYGEQRFMRMQNDRLTKIPSWYKLVKADWMYVWDANTNVVLERHYQEYKSKVTNAQSAQ